MSTNDSIQLSAVPINTVQQTDSFLMVSNTSGNTVVQSFLANGFSNVTVTFGGVIITANSTPANSTSTQNVTPGLMWSDGQYLYVGCNNSTVKRVLLSTF